MRLLIVCSANRTRSPMAEVIARRLATVDLLPIAVTSAGFRSAGHPALPKVQKVMGQRGFDLSRHRSRTLTDGLVDDADLIVTMEADHVIRLVATWPECVDRAFTLKELPLICEMGPSDLNRDSVRTWAADLHRDAALPTDDSNIEDPSDRSKRVIARTADELTVELTRIIDLLRPPTLEKVPRPDTLTDDQEDGG